MQERVWAYFFEFWDSNVQCVQLAGEVLENSDSLEELQPVQVGEVRDLIELLRVQNLNLINSVSPPTLKSSAADPQTTPATNQTSPAN